MLRQLASQVQTFKNPESNRFTQDDREFLAKIVLPIELIVLYPEPDIECHRLRALLQEELGTEFAGFRLRLVGAEDLHYYQFKNLGFDHSSGDIIVFLDS